MVKLTTCECKQCGYKWIPRVTNPSVCPGCHTSLWNSLKRDNNYGRPRKITNTNNMVSLENDTEQQK